MRFRLDVDGERREIEVEPTAGRLRHPDRRGNVSGPGRPDAEFVDVRIGAKHYRLRSRETRRSLAMKSTVYGSRTSPKNPAVGSKVRPTGRGAVVEIRSLMPGRVVRVAVAAGSQVRRGQTLVILEAMKMQNEIPAPGMAWCVRSRSRRARRLQRPGRRVDRAGAPSAS